MESAISGLETLRDFLPGGTGVDTLPAGILAELGRRFCRAMDAGFFRPILPPPMESREVYAAVGYREELMVIQRSVNSAFPGEIALSPASMPGIARSLIENGAIRSGGDLRFYSTPTRFWQEETGAPHAELEFTIAHFREEDPAADLQLIVLAYDFLSESLAKPLTVWLNPEGNEEALEAISQGLDVLGIDWREDIGLKGDPWMDGRLLYAIEDFAVGGRGDSLVEKLGSTPTPACGLRLNVESICSALADMEHEARPVVHVAYLDEGVKAEALGIARELRTQGVKTHFPTYAKNMTRHWKEADRLEIPWMAIVGGPEWDEGKVMLRNIISRDERPVLRTRLLEVIFSSPQANPPPL